MEGLITGIEKAPIKATCIAVLTKKKFRTYWFLIIKLEKMS